VAVSLINARQEWAEGQRRLDALRPDRVLHARLLANVELVTEELRRRVGTTFTLSDLAVAYDRAEDWTRHVLEERGAPGWPIHLTLVLDAAFQLYARGAVDYRP
jgi:anthranilate phosphoribosyltransferase